MKKYRKIIISAFVIMSVIMFPAINPFMETSYAASLNKPVLLKAGKTYKYDINGGKKEKIKYQIKQEKQWSSKFVLYINGKRIYSFTKDGMALDGVYLTDFNKKDKWKEIVFNYGTGQSDAYVVVLRVNKKKKVTTFQKYSGSGWKGRVEYDGKKDISIGNGAITLTTDTPYYSSTFGCYYAQVKVNLKNGKIHFKRGTYKIVKPSYWNWIVDVFGEDYYILSRSMTLYSASGKKKKLQNCDAYTRFTPIAVKPAGKASDDSYNLWVKVKIKGGKTGWFYFPGKTGTSYLTNVPMWG